jgi:hypothetical protein
MLSVTVLTVQDRKSTGAAETGDISQQPDEAHGIKWKLNLLTLFAFKIVFETSCLSFHLFYKNKL